MERSASAKRRMERMVGQAVHLPSIALDNVSSRSGSSQAALRHPKDAAYRCFLPDLTGFTAFRRVGPSSQHRSQRQRSSEGRPPGGIQPR